MGTDLWPIGNHNICFKNRRFNELATEIKLKLESISFINAKFLKHYALWANSNDPRRVREIKTKQNWTYPKENEFYNFAEEREIDFNGPFALNLTFDENKILFWDPTIRYRSWFEIDDNIFRDEWRKYMQQVVRSFGGNRVLYAADNSHHLEEYTYYEGSFEEMECSLYEKFGKSKSTFQEVVNDYRKSYFIDDFKSIDWSKSEPIESYLPIPDDTSSMDYDLLVYSSKENLKELNFNDTMLKHKCINGKINFYHLATIEGLLCIHTGLVGEHEKIKVKLDKYAPFTYDNLVKKIKNAGYGNQCNIGFIIHVKGCSSINNWREALDEYVEELKWQGIGKQTALMHSKEELKLYFYSVNQNLALGLLSGLSEKYKIKSKIDVYRCDDDDKIFDDEILKKEKLIYSA